MEGGSGGDGVGGREGVGERGRREGGGGYISSIHSLPPFYSTGEFSGGLPLGAPLTAAGGHAVTLVGFSDTYTSSAGHVGGLIIKNSWSVIFKT